MMCILVDFGMNFCEGLNALFSFLLDRLLQYERVDSSSSDSDATASSESEGEGPKEGGSSKK